MQKKKGLPYAGLMVSSFWGHVSAPVYITLSQWVNLKRLWVLIKTSCKEVVDANLFSKSSIRCPGISYWWNWTSQGYRDLMQDKVRLEAHTCANEKGSSKFKRTSRGITVIKSTALLLSIFCFGWIQLCNEGFLLYDQIWTLVVRHCQLATLAKHQVPHIDVS